MKFRAAFPAVLLLALALEGCTTGHSAQVTRVHALPSASGQSFVIQFAEARTGADPQRREYADVTRRQLLARGFREARSAAEADLLVDVHYWTRRGGNRTALPTGLSSGSFGRAYTVPSTVPGTDGRTAYRGGYEALNGDPFRGLSDGASSQVNAALTIRRAADGEPLFVGRAESRRRAKGADARVEHLLRAIFEGFPGRSGESRRVFVADDEGADTD